jgi:hypothetical protein
MFYIIDAYYYIIFQIIILFHPKARCPEVSLVRNSVLLNTPSHLPGTLATFKCNLGHRFPDGTFIKDIQCRPEDPQWSLLNHYCIGRLTLKLFCLRISRSVFVEFQSH